MTGLPVYRDAGQMGILVYIQRVTQKFLSGPELNVSFGYNKIYKMVIRVQNTKISMIEFAVLSVYLKMAGIVKRYMDV